ncbi:nucleotidyl transferase AbiEii/AbiGii toxin family protein [Candidatus Dojkabacteria bacterium]|jgi:predicted nucleotidyltransferase component of viral defense system|nr:nucleotidyl transferase AbiEii/AbiGii toxin family protein [Candidatus Dojkabacteria bacterium]
MHPIKYQLQTIVQEEKSKNKSNALIRNKLKEYLQDIILYIIYSDKKYKGLIFYGGTLLRKVYGLNRLSEDLDFESTTKIDIEEVASMIRKYFKEEHFNGVEVTTQRSENIMRCLVKFELLHDLGLSENVNEKLHVKVEINERIGSNYPTGYTPYTKDIYSMVIKHYSLPILMASKMIACIERVFRKGKSNVSIKGRDFYDLIWYMEKGIEPDKAFLEDNGYTINEAWKSINQVVNRISTKDLLIDLEPLFENSTYINEWCNNFHSFYKKLR